jgi:hypothetical protein
MSSDSLGRRKWSVAESDALSAAVDGGAKGQGGWAAVSASMKSKGYSRNEKQCRERYNNFLAPDLRASADPLCAAPLSAAEEKRCVAMKTENPKLDWTSLAETLSTPKVAGDPLSGRIRTCAPSICPSPSTAASAPPPPDCTHDRSSMCARAAAQTIKNTVNRLLSGRMPALKKAPKKPSTARRSTASKPSLKPAAPIRKSSRSRTTIQTCPVPDTSSDESEEEELEELGDLEELDELNELEYEASPRLQGTLVTFDESSDDAPSPPFRSLASPLASSSKPWFASPEVPGSSIAQTAKLAELSPESEAMVMSLAVSLSQVAVLPRSLLREHVCS